MSTSNINMEKSSIPVRIQSDDIRPNIQFKCPLEILALIANEKVNTEFPQKASEKAMPTKEPKSTLEPAVVTYEASVPEPEAPKLEHASSSSDSASEGEAYSPLNGVAAPRRSRRKNAHSRQSTQFRLQKYKRLNQNHLYRIKLQEVGVYPLRKGPKNFSCSLCKEIFEKEMFVWRHGVKHLSHKPFVCTICNGKFNRSDSLQRHIRNFHNETADLVHDGQGP